MAHRMLLILDDPAVEEQLRPKLRDHRHRLSIMTSPPFELEAMREFDPEVILLDTGENGHVVQMRHRLLQDPALAQVPLVILAKDATEARALGAQAFFTRPFDTDSLVMVLEALAEARMAGLSLE
jgi:DNA-binding response OmpR family regulator